MTAADLSLEAEGPLELCPQAAAVLAQIIRADSEPRSTDHGQQELREGLAIEGGPERTCPP